MKGSHFSIASISSSKVCQLVEKLGLEKGNNGGKQREKMFLPLFCLGDSY